MASLSGMLERIRGVDLERALGLRPAAPRVAIELERGAIALVRLRTKRGSRPTIEGMRVTRTEEALVPASIFDQTALGPEQLGQKLGELFEHSGIRPGRVGLVLPDNLAKIALLQLPERPPSRRQLEELIRFKMNRAIPFRVTEAALSYQLLPADGGRGITFLVALTRRALVDRFERALEVAGGKPGLIDLCTPNLLNLCRERIASIGQAGDVGLLNCTASYFSLLIVRAGRLIFYRCKSNGVGNGSNGAPERPHTFFMREIAGSLSYYREKLGGAGLCAVLVRSVVTPVEEILGWLTELGVPNVEAVVPLSAFALGEGVSIEPELAQQLAPALGVVAGRG